MYWITFNKNIDWFKWHYWFAWYPVTVYVYSDGSKKKIWWEWVYRCYYWEQIDISGYAKVPVYREIK